MIRFNGRNTAVLLILNNFEKFDSKADEGIFLGYSLHGHA